MSELKITIVTAVYNGEKYIEECIKSIMNQTYQNFEHIIMDGGSTANYAQTECQFRYCGTAIPFLTVRSTAR